MLTSGPFTGLKRVAGSIKITMIIIQHDATLIRPSVACRLRKVIVSAFEQYYVEVLRFLTRKLRDHDSAQDLTQETFSRALTLPPGGDVASPRGLLYQIARNLLIDRYRSSKRQSHENLEDIDESSIVAPGSWQPEAQAESSQHAARLVAIIKALPPRCRQAFVLHRIDGLSQSEVAKQMGISTNMVEKHIIRAMVACREGSASGQDSKG